MPCLLPGRWRNRAMILIGLETYIGFGPNRLLDGLPYRRDCLLTGDHCGFPVELEGPAKGWGFLRPFK